MSVARGMLALLSATLRDPAYHGFEAARYSYRCILSMTVSCIGLTLRALRRSAATRSSLEGLRWCPPGIQCWMLITLLARGFLPPKGVRVLTKVRTV
jgi:hypothetical protein